MGKRLAIRGHDTRGDEVIELLEMLGGTNPFSKGMVIGNKTTNCYYISEDTATKYISWDCIGPEEINEYEIFTLEEFLEKYPYKIGDKIPDVWGNSCTVKSMSWDDNYKTVMYGFEETIFVVRGDELKPVNDTDDNHTEPSKMKNVLAELLEHIKTTPKEELEREFEEIKEWSNVGPTIKEFITFCECVNKKPVYPKTYDECCEMLNADEFVEYELMANFPKLINARNAYWKIAGDEMGLDKTWKPDWNGHEFKYGLKFMGHRIEKTSEMTISHVICFPTAEMRDAFYENFKDLIDSCKELL